MGSNFLEDGQVEARRQVQQAIDALKTTAGVQDRYESEILSRKRHGHDSGSYQRLSDELSRQYSEQDKNFRLLEDAYRKQFPDDLEAFVTTIDLTPR